jgi:hypothetical protein
MCGAQKHMWFKRRDYAVGLVADHQDRMGDAVNPERAVGNAGLFPPIGEKMLPGDWSLCGGGTYGRREIGHLDRQDLVERAVAKRLHGGVCQLLVPLLVLDQNVARLPRQIGERAQQDDSPGVAIPIRRGVELYLDVPQAVALQDQGLVTKGPTNLNGGVDVAAHVKKIVGVDLVVVLARVDGKRCIALRRQARTKAALRSPLVASATTVDYDKQRRITRLLAVRLPERRVHPESIDGLDRQERERNALALIEIRRESCRTSDEIISTLAATCVALPGEEPSAIKRSVAHEHIGIARFIIE